MSLRRLLVFSHVVSLIVTFAAWGDSSGVAPERVYVSSSGAYSLTVTPDRRQRPGHSRVVLRRSQGLFRAVVWSRYLINNLAPQRALVADTGKCVVTIDEWGRGGFLPVVIYGGGGELVYVHTLESLRLTGIDDAVDLEFTEDGRDWSRNADIFFDSDSEVLFIAFSSALWRAVDLSTGELITDAWVREQKGFSAVADRWTSLQKSALDRISRLTRGEGVTPSNNE